MSEGQFKILQVFSRYLEYGGEEATVDRISEALRTRCSLERYYNSTEELLARPMGKIRTPLSMLRNPEVLRDLRRLQEEHQFSAWQIHNVFPGISIAIYELAAELGVPIIQYLHNYRFGCPPATYFIHGEVCTRCSPDNFMPGVVRRCWRDSLPATLAMVTALKRFWQRDMANQIKAFIAVSQQQKEMHVKMGLPHERIHVLPHFMEAGPPVETTAPFNGDVLFLGRITAEKGVDLLLRAWGKVDARCRTLRIVGDGPELESMKVLARRLSLANVVFEGFVPRDQHEQLWRKASFSVVPSKWMEPFGLVVLEAWRQGRPVLATRLGSFPELITPGTNGWLAAPEVGPFTEALQEALDAGPACAEMGVAGRSKLEVEYERDYWLEGLLGIYREVGLKPQQRQTGQIARESSLTEAPTSRIQRIPATQRLIARILITGGSGFIGTNTVAHFLKKGVALLNLDIQKPFDRAHEANWQPVDILDPERLMEAFREFQPDAVIHLAARAECDENTTVGEGYRANTDGTQYVLEAIKATPSVKRAIITSSQFVCGPDHPPKDEYDFGPVTVYGESKVVTEKLTRSAGLECTWTLIRPTNIWGPWHQRYVNEFWNIVRRGFYIHPGGGPVVRCYGYVGNLVAYLDRILEAPPEHVHEQVFYLSDPADDIFLWANAFSKALRGRRARRVPRPVLWSLAKVGDVLSRFRDKPFYIHSSRYRSMISEYRVPGAIEKTIAILGPPPISLEEGVRETMGWLREENVWSIKSNASGT